MEKKDLPAEVSPFALMDKLDDELIAAELEGRIKDIWVYHFKTKKGEVWGLSKIGIDEACRELSKRGEVIREISLEHQVDPIDPEYMLFKAQAGRYAVIYKEGVREEILLETVFGTKRQWRKQLVEKEVINKETKEKKVIKVEEPNPYWYEQGSIKALRNARARLIPEEIKTAIIAFAKEKGKVKEIIEKKPEKPKPAKEEKPETEPAKKEEEPKVTDFKKFLDAMAEMKKELGEEVYYKILGYFGYEHSNEIKDRESQERVYSEMRRYLRILRENKELRATEQSNFKLE